MSRSLLPGYCLSMAAKVNLLQGALGNNKQDITRNLPSLTFESAVDEEELLLLHLRQQSHAHTVTVSATCTFLVHTLNEARQIRADLAKTTKQRRAIQLMTADSLPKDPLKIGIIGCGRLGTHIAQTLLTFGEVNEADLIVSTRRIETLGELRDRGVRVVHNNPVVAASVHVLFLCVLPSQLPSVIEEIERHIPKQTLVYCLVNHTKAPKLKRTLKSTNIIIPDFVFNSSAANKWNSCKSVSQALEDEEMINNCCPLTQESQEACVHLTDKWVELIICGFINHCTDLELTSQAALDLLHGICMGMDSLEKGSANRFIETDFIINWKMDNPEPRKFPKFDLSKIHDHDSNVIKKLRGSPHLRKSFVNKFSAVFKSYLEWKKYNAEVEES